MNCQECNKEFVMAPGFMQPEGIVLYHPAADKCFKVTLEDDEKPKGLLEPICLMRQKCKTT